MFERFTRRARQSVVLAQEEARRLGHDYIGTEHLLLGLLRDPESVAGRALLRLRIRLDIVRSEVDAIVGRGSGAPEGHIPFTPRAKKVLELALREALQLRHNYIGTEHILLGVVREGEGLAAQVLVNRGASLEQVREAVLGELGSGQSESIDPSPSPRTPAADEAILAAEQLAGGAPTGSHHLLEALVRSEQSVAAKVLAALGIDPETLAAKVDEIDVEGTTDITPEESAARRMEVLLADDAVHVVLRDAESVDIVRTATERLGGPVRGDDPLLTGAFVGLWRSTVAGLRDVAQLLAPPLEPEGKPSSRSALVQRAIQSRLRRRRQA
jgi:ATP-dependent Clp protease ATP-binding subunit ClpC